MTLEVDSLRSQLDMAREEILALNEGQVQNGTILTAAMAEIDVLTFKVSNLTTERDVANQEIERLRLLGVNVINRADAFDAQLTAAKEEIERLKREIEKRQVFHVDAEELVNLRHELTAEREKVQAHYNEAVDGWSKYRIEQVQLVKHPFVILVTMEVLDGG